MTDHAPSVVAAATLREAAENAADWLNRVQLMHHTIIQRFPREDVDTCDAGMCGDYREHRDALRAALRAESVAVASPPPWNDADMNVAYGIGYEAGKSAALHAPPALDAARMAESAAAGAEEGPR